LESVHRIRFPVHAKGAAINLWLAISWPADARGIDRGVIAWAKGSHNVPSVWQEPQEEVLSLGRIAAAGPRADFQSDLHGQVREWLGIRL
jgi:hypothetical protein